MLRQAYHNRNNDTATVRTNDIARNLVAGGTYDIGTIRVHFAYGVNKGSTVPFPGMPSTHSAMRPRRCCRPTAATLSSD